MTDASGSPGEESKADRTDTRRPDRVAADENGTTRRTALKAGAVTAATAALAGCSALLGGGDDDSGEAADVGTDRLEAGLLTFTQGAASVLGIQAQRGAEKAVERINEAGGIAGQREVSLDVVDETESPTDDYQQFIDDGKDVTFGPVSSGTHESIAPDIETNEVVNVATDGTVTTLYEETNPNPTYSFRFQNYDVMEATTAALEIVERLGADEIDTYAGVNPDYTFGRDEMEVFSLAIEGITGAEEVYSGFPALGESDFSTYISRINDEEPDIVFSSCWGGDASNFLSQAFQRNMFDNVDVVVGPVFYGSANAIDEEVVTGTDRGTILAGSRNYYWGLPRNGRSEASTQLFEEAREQDDITVPTAHYMSGYGAVTAWATAVEKAIEIVGGYPSQEQIAMTLEEHGFYTPAGYHNVCADHTGRSNGYAGVMEWDGDLGAPVLTDVNVYPSTRISPPPMGTDYESTAMDWLNSWD